MAKEEIAYFDASHDFPEEIVMAAGYTPVKLTGDVHAPNEPADQYLFQTFCPLARSILTQALNNPNKWRGIILAHGCDATNRHFDVWKLHVKTPFLYWFNTPMNISKSAAKFFKRELEVLVGKLEGELDVEITQTDLKEAIKKSNQVKELLQKLSKLRSTQDISNVEYLNTVKSAMVGDKDETIKLLEDKVADWTTKDNFPRDKNKILLTGSDLTYPEFMQWLEDAGLRVVRDDLTIGERYFAEYIPEDMDPLDAIVDYHFNIPRPATKHPPEPRLDFILHALEETPVDGVLSQNIKFCETYAYDAVWIKESIKAKGVPISHLERDYVGKADHQIINRIEAFSEILDAQGK